MNRITFFEKDGKTMVQEERLQKQPSGNGDQRRKQIRNGWQPSWVKTGIAQEMSDDMDFYLGMHILPELGMLVPAEELIAGNMIARWVTAMQSEGTEENRAKEKMIIDRQFCLESGLVSALEDDTAPKLTKTVSDALAVLAHTCIDQPSQPCANPECSHEPVTP